jgi:(S)-2-hydroxy-acid oxidase
MAQKFVCVEDYEKHASQVLKNYALAYYKDGADQEQSLQDNREAFKRYCLLHTEIIKLI